MKKVGLLLFALLLVLARADDSVSLANDSDFSPWLTTADDNGDQLGDYLKPLKDQNLYVNAVEGRWNNGHAEFRVRTASRPTDSKLRRYWWFDATKDCYYQQLEKLTIENTYKCVWSQHFTDGEGIERYQMVFLKFVPLTPAADGASVRP